MLSFKNWCLFSSEIGPNHCLTLTVAYETVAVNVKIKADQGNRRVEIVPQKKKKRMFFFPVRLRIMGLCHMHLKGDSRKSQESFEHNVMLYTRSSVLFYWPRGLESLLKLLFCFVVWTGRRIFLVVHYLLTDRTRVYYCSIPWPLTNWIVFHAHQRLLGCRASAKGTIWCVRVCFCVEFESALCWESLMCWC